MSFEELLEENRLRVEIYVKYRVDNKADQEDLLQEIFLKAYENFDKLQKETAFRAWIVSIARNAVNDYYRRKNNETELPLDEDLAMSVSINRPLSEKVNKVLNELPKTDRQILRLFYWKEYTLAEIAERLQIAPGTVKSRLFNARQHFKERYPKEENMQERKMPAIMPEYSISQLAEEEFEVVWEELMGWFLVPKEGNSLIWGIYDFPERKLAETYIMKCEGKAEVHGLPGVKVYARELADGEERERKFIAQLSDTHCRYLAESHFEEGIEKYYTFLDGAAFIDNWGFGPDNIGNEIHLKKKGLISREGNLVESDPDSEVMDVVGRYKVSIGGKAYDTICLMDIGRYDENTITEQYIDRNGRTVLWRRFNKGDKRWLFDGFEEADEEKLKDNEVLIVNGKKCLHWYDCISEYVL